jgi:hypothetical protein
MKIKFKHATQVREHIEKDNISKMYHLEKTIRILETGFIIEFPIEETEKFKLVVLWQLEYFLIDIVRIKKVVLL